MEPSPSRTEIVQMGLDGDDKLVELVFTEQREQVLLQLPRIRKRGLKMANVFIMDDIVLAQNVLIIERDDRFGIAERAVGKCRNNSTDSGVQAAVRNQQKFVLQHGQLLFDEVVRCSGGDIQKTVENVVAVLRTAWLQTCFAQLAENGVIQRKPCLGAAAAAGILQLHRDDGKGFVLQCNAQLAAALLQLLLCAIRRPEKLLQKLRLQLRQIIRYNPVECGMPLKGFALAVEIVERLLQATRQIFREDWFREQIDRAQTHGMLGIFKIGIACDDDEAHVRVERRDGVRQLQTGDDGDTDIRDDDFRAVQQIQLHSAVAVRSFADHTKAERLPVDHGPQPLPDGQIVVDQHDVVHSSISYSLLASIR